MNFKEDWYIIIPTTIILVLYTLFLFHKQKHCAPYSYKTTCRKCIWVTHDNGYNGRLRRTWNECIGYKYYNCTLTVDTCNCNDSFY